MTTWEFESPRRREGSGNNFRIDCQEDMSVCGLRLFIFGGRDKVFAADNIPLKEIDVCDFIPTAMVINHTEAQGLMESLWKAGIRPRSGEGSVGQLGAVERHLADMRAMVAKYTKTELK